MQEYELFEAMIADSVFREDEKAGDGEMTLEEFKRRFDLQAR